MRKSWTASDLIVAARFAGYEVAPVSDETPKLVRFADNVQPLDPKLLERLKANRIAVVRLLLFTKLCSRSTKKGIWGYCSTDIRKGIDKAKKGVLADHWDRVCLEGDLVWTELPPLPDPK